MDSRSTTRPGVRAGTAVAAALAVLTLAACGQQDAGGGAVSGSSSTSDGSVTPTPSTSAPSTPAADLTVTLDDGNGTTSTWSLTCAEDGTAGGDHPDAANACAALAAAAGSDPFKPVPKDMACTMVYGGPQKATVRGTWNGRDVLASFDRTDGCQTARWDRLAPLLQPGTTAGRSAGPT